MIIYSDMPMELIFEGMEDQDKQAAYQEMKINGIIMQVLPMSGYEAKIVRLISPNANDYLNPAYAPGQIIRFRPNL